MVRGTGFEPGNPAFETGTVASYVSRANWRSRQESNLDPEFRIL